MRESNKRHGGIIIVRVPKTYYYLILSLCEKDTRLRCIYFCIYFSEFLYFIFPRAITPFNNFRNILLDHLDVIIHRIVFRKYFYWIINCFLTSLFANLMQNYINVLSFGFENLTGRIPLYNFGKLFTTTFNWLSPYNSRNLPAIFHREHFGTTLLKKIIQRSVTPSFAFKN